MNTDALLNELFPGGHSVVNTNNILTGFATTAKGEIAVMGTTEHLAIGVDTALKLADFVLAVIKEHPGQPILMLVDTQGQRLSLKDELLGINGYLAHLVKCLELARQQGHQLITLVYSEAVSGGFLAFGMMADEIHTLADGKVRVMNLPAMSRITKLPLEQLQELSSTSAIFAPGIENFIKLGGVQTVWQEPLSEQLESVIGLETSADQRRQNGMIRQGRKLACSVAQRVIEA
ncbi:MAG: biotin-independent malonate decarboxylase subunit gamma [Candidatus Marinimicrobia bacterium]|nr:biotin-independent malonate decarboxylase subunit gamma [Candidatus Neomarinimicrobiota bacterium]